MDILTAVRNALSESKPLDYRNRGACVRSLQFVYHAMVASEPLLRQAIDASTGPLRDYFTCHLEEEAGHAGWLAADLEGDIGSPHPLVVGMVGRQYYLIHHVSPAALLGYMVLMECFPTPLDMVAEMEALHGEGLFRTLRHHAEHDIDHGHDVLAQIDLLPAHEQVIAIDNAIQSARYMALASSTF